MAPMADASWARNAQNRSLSWRRSWLLERISALRAHHQTLRQTLRQLRALRPSVRQTHARTQSRRWPATSGAQVSRPARCSCMTQQISDAERRASVSLSLSLFARLAVASLLPERTKHTHTHNARSANGQWQLRKESLVSAASLSSTITTGAIRARASIIWHFSETSDTRPFVCPPVCPSVCLSVRLSELVRRRRARSQIILANVAERARETSAQRSARLHSKAHLRARAQH